MLRPLFLTSALAVVGSLPLAPIATAQTVNVPFSGNISSLCVVGQITPGMLGQILNPISGQQFLRSWGGSGTPTSGSVAVNCVGDVTIRVDEVSLSQWPTNLSDPSSVAWYAEVISPSSNQIAFRRSSGEFENASLVAGNHTLRVDMEATRTPPNNLPTGNYQFQVQFTLVP